MTQVLGSGRTTRWAAAAALVAVSLGIAGVGASPPASAASAPQVIPAPATLVRRVAGVASTDGKWNPRVNLRGRTVVWATHYHPLPKYPTVVASAAVIDQFSLKAGLFNGPQVPGLTWPWRNGPAMSNAAKPWLVAAFNGGFLFKHMYQSGYMTEGHTLKPLVAGTATLAISKSGIAKVGLWGYDIPNNGTWKSVRQNLPALVMNGANVTYTHVYTVWGVNDGTTVAQKTITNRSAICARADTRLMYVFAGNVNVGMFADALVNMGCRFAMELDINGTWPQFATYAGYGTYTRTGVGIDSRMSNLNRYVTYSQKDYFAFFDPVPLGAGVLG